MDLLTKTIHKKRKDGGLVLRSTFGATEHELGPWHSDANMPARGSKALNNEYLAKTIIKAIICPYIYIPIQNLRVLIKLVLGPLVLMAVLHTRSAWTETSRSCADELCKTSAAAQGSLQTSSRALGTQRVQVPNIQGLWSQEPLRIWLLEPETSNVGYLDPLGGRALGTHV